MPKKESGIQADEQGSGDELVTKWREKYSEMEPADLVNELVTKHQDLRGMHRKNSSLVEEVTGLQEKLSGESDLHTKSVEELREYGVALKIREGRINQRERAMERALADEIPLSLAVQLVGASDDVTDKNIDTLISEIDRVAGNRVNRILGSGPRPESGSDKGPLTQAELNRVGGKLSPRQFKKAIGAE